MEDTSKPWPWLRPDEETPEQRLARAREIWRQGEEREWQEYGAAAAARKQEQERMCEEDAAWRAGKRRKAYQAAEAERARAERQRKETEWQKLLREQAQRDRTRQIAREIEAAREAAKARTLAKALAREAAEQRLKLDNRATARRAQYAAKELRAQHNLYRDLIEKDAIMVRRRQRARRAMQTSFSYLMAAEGQHQDNLLRIVGQQFNRLLEEVAPFEEGCSLDEAISPESDYWGARFELQTEGQRDKRQYNRFHGSGPKWGTRQSVA
jgi:hypothetical protein